MLCILLVECCEIIIDGARLEIYSINDSFINEVDSAMVIIE
jgi:hypothetical protein